METCRTKILGFSLLLGGLALCGTGLWQVFSPAQYRADVRIIVVSEAADIVIDWNDYSRTHSYDPYFIQTTFEIIRSPVVLSNVIEALNLNDKWSKKYFWRGKLETKQTVSFLRKRVNVQAVPKTAHIKISVTSEDPNEAAHLANAIAKSYQDYRLEVRKQLTAKGIEVLQRQYQIDEEKIRVAQTNLDSLRNKLFSATYTHVGPSPSWILTSYTNQLIENREKETRLTQLQAMSREKRRAVLPTMITDGLLSNLLSQLYELEQKVALITNDYSTTNPVLQIQAQLDELNRQVDDRVNGIMAALESVVKFEKARLNAMTSEIQMAEEAQKEEDAIVTNSKSYLEDEQKLEEILKFHKLLAGKIEAEKLNLSMPLTSMVAIVDPAVPPQTPIGPNRVLGALLLAIGLFPTVGGFLLLKSSRRQFT